jgi:hypothetical protein
MIFFTITIAAFVVVKRPFTGCLDNFTLAFTSICYSVVLILFLVLHNNTGGLSPKDRHNKLGLACVILIVAIGVVNLLLALYKMIETIIEFIKETIAKFKTKIKVPIYVESQEELKINFKIPKSKNMTTEQGLRDFDIRQAGDLDKLANDVDTSKLIANHRSETLRQK